MEKMILISETSLETRIAILENGELVELFVEKPGAIRTVGNIYKGKVENVVEAIQAAFVDIGYKLNAFLPFSEINSPPTSVSIMDSIIRGDEEDREIKPEPEEISLKPGQDLLVQIVKEAFATKGPRITTDISIPGRFLVLVPNADYVGISKKIVNKNERRRLRRIVQLLKPDNFGIIIRTVSDGKDKKTLKADLSQLLENWKSTEEAIKKSSAPACVYRDMEMTSIVIRDLLSSDIDKIIVNTKPLYKKLKSYIGSVSPEFASYLELSRSRIPLFDRYNIEKEFEKSLAKKVWLKSGGFIVIDHTEAMCTIDVNSGKFIGKKNHENNSLKINLEAARKIAHQLRLRDIGGLVVIDFIDMEENNNKKRIFQELHRELSKDRARVALSPISDFGLLEMTRQRTRRTLLYSVSEQCPTCHGSGRITSKDSLVTKIERWIGHFKTKSRERRITLLVHPEMATFIRESTDNLLRRLQWHNLLLIKLQEDPLINIDDFHVYSIKTGEDITDKY